jgi:signal transduction histidine kinase/DNA-binding response OmpR family regulator
LEPQAPVAETHEPRPRWAAVHLIAAGIAVTIAVTSLTVFELRRVSDSVERLVQRDMENSARVAEIVWFDEILTMSSRLAAATGDEGWIARYHEYEPKLTAAIAASMELAPDAYAMGATSATNDANDALVAMETRSFELVEQGRAAEALELLSSDEYHAQKEIYATGMERVREAIARSIDGRVDDVRNDLALARQASIAVVTVLSFGWLLVLVLVRRLVLQQTRTERELVNSRSRAESAMLAKANFLANMSHEIRTPLNGVIGMNELLAGTLLDHDQHQYVQNIRSSGEALLHVIDDILDYSKIDAGKLHLETIPFDLGTTLEDAGALLAPRAAANGVELVLSVDGDVPQRLCGDPTRILQVLLNLAGNAVKFTSRGEIRIAVSLDREAAVARESVDAVALRIDVTDTGIGIPAERIPALFTAFEQVDTSTTRRFGGTGLGLAISRRLVELMGGTLTATSEVGVGSTFSVRMPCALDTSEPIQRPQGEHSTAEFAAEFAALRVLVVDDYASTREVLRKQLEDLGCAAETADGGESALELVERRAAEGRAFNIAFLDFRMPKMDGIELAQKLRERADGASMGLALISADPRAAASTVQTVDVRLLKPVRRRELESALRRLLNPLSGAAPKRDDSLDALSSRLESLNLNVLVAEDNVVNQRVVGALLRRAGVHCEIVGDGQAAIEALAARRFDLVLMDCQMPRLDGYEATQRIRADELARSAARIPIVALTAHALEGERRRCEAAGMDGYLTKPIRPAALYDEILLQVEAPNARSSNAA